MSDVNKRLEALAAQIRDLKAGNEAEIRREIKDLFKMISLEIKSYESFLDRLKAMANEFKNKRYAKSSMDQFYSFLKSRTVTELDVATLIDRAWNLICIEEFDDAAVVLEQVLSKEPKNVRAIGLLALTFMSREKYDEAMLHLQQVLMIEPDNPFALNNLGYICYKKGIWGEAIEHLTKATKQKKDRLAALYANYYLGLVYLERMMLADATRFFEQALTQGPNLQEAHYYLGLAEVKRYDFKKAVRHFENCIKIDRDSRHGKLARVELDKVIPLINPELIMHRTNKKVERRTK